MPDRHSPGGWTRRPQKIPTVLSGEVSMFAEIFIADPRPGSFGRRFSCAALLATSMIFTMSAGNADDLARANSAREADGKTGIAARSDRQQLSLATVRSDVPASG